ncbi:MAG: hypothetical protein RTU30_05430 [Candidatus Thorarchaeota archaeon]
MTIDVTKVRYIALIRLEGGESVLNVPYAELTVDPDLIAGFVTAVIIFAKTPIRTIRKAAYDILIEVGETVLVLLVVDPIPDETPFRNKLKRILDQVEEEHGGKLREFEGDIRRFREFTLDILKEFPYGEPDLNLIPVVNPGAHTIPFRVGQIDRKIEQVEAFINGKRTLMEIMDLIDLPEPEIIAIFSVLQRYGKIELKRKLTEIDVLMRKNCPQLSIDRLKSQYGQPVQDLLNRCDGVNSIGTILGSLPYDRDALWFLINKLVDEGCVETTSPS